MTSPLSVSQLLAAAAFAILFVACQAKAQDFHSDEFWRERKGWASNAFTEGGRTPGARRYRYAKDHRPPHDRDWRIERIPYDRWERERDGGRYLSEGLHTDRQGAPNLYRDPSSNVECWPYMEDISAEHNTEEAAWKDAQSSIMNKAKWKVGERFMELDNAIGVTKQCTRSTASQGLVGRATDAVREDGHKWRCEIRARFCMAPRLDVNTKGEQRADSVVIEQPQTATIQQPKRRFWQRKAQ